MADKKEMNKAILMQLAGFILIFIVPRFFGGLLPFIICAVIGVPLIGLGFRKYRQEKSK